MIATRHLPGWVVTAAEAGIDIKVPTRTGHTHLPSGACCSDSARWVPKASRVGVQVSMFDPGPQRIQLSRAKGWRKPTAAVVVARPARWGNPFVIGTPENGGNITRRQAVEFFEAALREGRLLGKSVADVRAELRDRDLCCWCPLDSPCHADVLLRLANAEGGAS